MPPAFNPRIVSTDKLRELLYQLQEQIIELQNEHTRTFQHWCQLGIINAPQSEQDVSQKACRNIRSKTTRATNKSVQISQELRNRDLQEIRNMT